MRQLALEAAKLFLRNDRRWNLAGIVKPVHPRILLRIRILGAHNDSLLAALKSVISDVADGRRNENNFQLRATRKRPSSNMDATFCDFNLSQTRAALLNHNPRSARARRSRRRRRRRSPPASRPFVASACPGADGCPEQAYGARQNRPFAARIESNLDTGRVLASAKTPKALRRPGCSRGIQTARAIKQPTINASLIVL